MKKLNIEKFYDTHIKKYAKGVSASFVFKSGLNKFANLVPPNELILDVGSGLGQETEYLVKKGHKVLGIDISKEMIKYSLDNRAEGLFMNIDFFKVGEIFQHSHFDGLWASSSILTHINKEEVRKFFMEARKMLTSKGVLGIIVSKDKFKGSYKIPFNNFSKREITSFVIKNGFKIIEFKELKLEKSTWFFILAKKDINSA